MHIDWIPELKNFSYLLFFLHKSWLSLLDVLFLLNKTWFFKTLTHNWCHLVVKIIFIELPKFYSVCLSFNLMYLLYLLVNWLIEDNRPLGIEIFVLLHHFLNCFFIELEIDVISCDHNTQCILPLFQFFDVIMILEVIVNMVHAGDRWGLLRLHESWITHFVVLSCNSNRSNLADLVCYCFIALSNSLLVWWSYFFPIYYLRLGLPLPNVVFVIAQALVLVLSKDLLELLLAKLVPL